MFGFVPSNPNKLLIITRNTSTPTTTTHHLRLPPVSLEPIQNQQPSLTVSYLINSCGLSPQSALSAAKKINIKTTKKPDSILNALKSYGFTDTQIAKFVAKCPAFLLSSFEKTIKPKLDLFIDVGFSSSELADLICEYPYLLKGSLQNRLKPNFELLSSIIHDKRKMTVALRRCHWLLTANLETSFLPNVRILQSCGVPALNISKLTITHPSVMMLARKKFATTVSSVKKFGFDPNLMLFVTGISVLAGMSNSTWERKVAVYKSVGWSEEDIVFAFTRYPSCMLISEEKIRRGMDFFMKKMHWQPSFLAANPVILALSLEKRIIPRCSVFSVLASKGLIVQNPSTRFLKMSKKIFLYNYVIKYHDQVPELLHVYNGNFEFVGLEGE